MNCGGGADGGFRLAGASLPWVEELTALKDRIGALFRRAEPQRQVGLLLEGLVGGATPVTSQSVLTNSLKISSNSFRSQRISIVPELKHLLEEAKARQSAPGRPSS